MAELYNWISHHFLEIFGLLSLILHALYFLLKHLQPVLEEGRARYLYIKSWFSNNEEVRVLTESQPKT